MNDQETIRDLQIRYCQCFDARDGDGYGAIFTEDGVLTLPGDRRVVGREELRKMARRAPPGGWHKALETTIAVTRDQGTGVCRFEAQGLDGRLLVGRYEDTYARIAGEWKIASRIAVVESSSNDAPGGPADDSVTVSA